MKIYKTYFFLIACPLLSCSNQPDISEKKNQPTDTTSIDSINTEDLDFTEKTLPGLEGVDLTNETYIIEEMLASIQSEESPGQNLSVVISEDQNVYLEIGYDKTGKEESWKLDLPIENPFGLQIKLEYTDANYDDVKDELVIWWSQSAGTSGIMSGYESANDGVIIFDVVQRTALVNLLYSHQYSTYSAAENANTNDSEFHAKMDDNSDWFICSFSHDVQLLDGELVLSNYHRENEGMGECGTIHYAEGTYIYNYSSGLFELEQGK